MFKKSLALILALIMTFSICIISTAEGENETITVTQAVTELTTEIVSTTLAATEPVTEATTGAITVTQPVTEGTTENVPETEENPYVYDAIYDRSDYKALLVKYGRPTVTTDQFLKFMSTLNFVYRFFTGRAFCPEEHLNVTVDAYIAALSEEVYNESGLDVAGILTNLPDINGLPKLTQKIFDIDTAAFRDEMYQKRDELYSNGETTKSSIYHFIGIYFSIIEHAELEAIPTEDPDVRRIKLTLHFQDGGTEVFTPGFFINYKTGECTSPNGRGLMSLGFDFDLSQMIVYATVNAWMRDFGFCVLYDVAANSMPLLWNYNTRRFHFDYDGLEWMIQIWKGNYLISNGGEVGMYNREPGSFGTFYNCATNDQLLPMSMQVYAGDLLLVDKKTQPHWWINGFRINGTHYPPSSLTLVFTIEMKDEEMLNAFREAIENHYMKDVSYKVEGLKITVTW